METRSVSFIPGIVIGVIFGIWGPFILSRAFCRRKLVKGEYDERQKLAQGKAYKCAFYTLLSYLTAAGIFDFVTGIRWCDLFTLAFIGLIRSTIVFLVICIKNNAYVSFRENPKRTIWVLLALGIMNLLIGIVFAGTPGRVITDGMLNYNIVNLLVGICLCHIRKNFCF